MVKNPPSNVGYTGFDPQSDWGTKIPHAEVQLSLRAAMKTQCCEKKKKLKPNPGSPKEGDRDSRRNTPIEKKYQPFPHTEVKGKAG